MAALRYAPRSESQMQAQARTFSDVLSEQLTERHSRHERRARCERVLQSALRKRALKVPTYTVPEAAALLSLSHEHLYRLIRADAFPAVPMSDGRARGRYVVPARVVEEILEAAADPAQRDNKADA